LDTTQLKSENPARIHKCNHD